ncbi:Stk1 family PASTA domain-containing Ser/Thr kinase [Bacillus marinisedimentorum]|uniref:Stk1 family PASTA domain-containing Ser/Thr kinase n=1 Tax=Bacillus marinisedimentorum TaxID=1821260 RepID=UPI0007DFAC43|nr:Stk1 family PASTA domain-containing Ser/Thr kinase [Bacillus marinisedimentorum]
MMIGKRLNGRYKLLEAIGGGGMANVYRAKDMILDRIVAVKVLRPEYSNDEEFIKRFRREAQSATSLVHNHVVSIFDVGEEDDIYFIVMEYVEGMTLKKYIQQNGPLPIDEALSIMKQVCSAVDHAHHNHIVHRDIKPQNILIDDEGTIKITDFGIAMALSATAITQTNSVLGSVHYLSPEQARGGLATNKSDIYSLGIVMFELLTGRLPFSGESAVSIALKHLQTETPSVRRWNPDIPQSVENIILKATAKDPFHRYRSIDEMEQDLETALDADRLNEQRFAPPEEDDEEVTKAIPVVTDDRFDEHDGETIIHADNGSKAPPPDDGNGGDKKKQGKWKKVLAVLFITLLLLGAAAAAAFTILPSMFAAKDVTIPEVAGMEYEDALNELTAAGLKVKREKRNDDEVGAGLVILTEPDAGTTVKEGYEVTVVESLGKEKMSFGDYTGMQFDAVKKELILKGFKEENIKEYEQDSDEQEGTILRQTQPSPGDEVIPEEAYVIFEVSKGPPKIELEDMAGWSKDRVYDYIERNTISLDEKEEYSDSVPAGQAIKQSPKAGTVLEEGSKITVIFSKGSEPEPEPEPEPKRTTIEVEVPYEPEEEGDGQTVKIYIGDEQNDISDVFKKEEIKNDKVVNIDLVVPYEGSASYKVTRDGEVIEEATVRYEDL